MNILNWKFNLEKSIPQKLLNYSEIVGLVGPTCTRYESKGAGYRSYGGAKNIMSMAFSVWRDALVVNRVIFDSILNKCNNCNPCP